MRGEIFLKEQVKYVTTKRLIISIIFLFSLFILILVYLDNLDVKTVLVLFIVLAVEIIFLYILSDFLEHIYSKLRKKKK